MGDEPNYCAMCGRRSRAPPSFGWQPIETAPKDGTEILLCVPDANRVDPVMNRRFVGWWWDERRPDPGWIATPPYRDGTGDDDLVSQPTHWMPIDAPPGDGDA